MASVMKQMTVGDGVTIGYRVFEGLEPAVVILLGLAGSSREFIPTSRETSVPVVLVGQSMGAHTAMLVASVRADLVCRLVILEGNQGGGSTDEQEAIGSYFRSWEVPFANRTEAAAALGDGPLERVLGRRFRRADRRLVPPLQRRFHASHHRSSR